MSDVVVTVPKSFGFKTWLEEGDLPGEPWSGNESFFFMGGHPPGIQPGDRVYIVFNDKLRGYAPLVRVQKYHTHQRRAKPRYALIRHGDAVAVTINEPIPGFRGFRYRWWKREDEVPFLNWMEE